MGRAEACCDEKTRLSLEQFVMAVTNVEDMLAYWRRCSNGGLPSASGSQSWVAESQQSPFRRKGTGLLTRNGP